AGSPGRRTAFVWRRGSGFRTVARSGNPGVAGNRLSGSAIRVSKSTLQSWSFGRGPAFPHLGYRRYYCDFQRSKRGAAPRISLQGTGTDRVPLGNQQAGEHPGDERQRTELRGLENAQPDLSGPRRIPRIGWHVGNQWRTGLDRVRTSLWRLLSA